ncbi:MAG: Ig-like domain-containing protein, partial [Casimicrobiaceae bacterium]
MRLDYLRGSLALVATVLSLVSPIADATVTGSCAGNACVLNFSPSLNFGEVWAARNCPASAFSDVPGKIKGPWGVYVYGSSYTWNYTALDPLAAGGNFCFFASTNGFSQYGWDVGWAMIYVPPYGGGGGTSPPVVSLSSPVSGATYGAPATIPLSASASSPNSGGSISKVEFYNGASLIATALGISPYTYSWTNVGAGTYSLTAKAYDNGGRTTTTAAASVTVNSVPAGNVADGSFELPSLALGNYVWASGATVAGSPWTFAGAASGSRGISANGSAYTAQTVGTADGKQVAFIQGDGTVSQVVNLAAGNYTVSVKAIQRKENFNAPAGMVLTIEVDGFARWSGVPNNVAYLTYTTPTMALGAGNHTITIRGTNQSTNDNTLFVDMVKIASVNQPPTVSLTITPSTGLVAPATTTLSATASDPDGTIAKVEFYDNGVLINSDAVSPYSFVWTNIPAGSHNVSVQAYDNGGAVAATSKVITVGSAPTGIADGSFELPPLTPPNFVAASGPTIAGSPWMFAGANGSRGISTNGSLFTAQTVNTTDGKQVAFIQGDGTISQAVNLAAGTYQVSVKAIQRKENHDAPAGITLSIEVDGAVKWTGAPGNVAYRTYATPAMALTAGSHTILIRSTNQFLGYDNTIFVDAVYVGAPVAPTVSLTAPAANQIYAAPATVSFAATAASSSGLITKVEFYNGATLIGSDLSSPYGFAWSNVAAGAYSVSALAYDTSGAVTASGSAPILVCGPPTLTMTSPASGATAPAPATFTLSANASTAPGC